eukprot:GILJ01002795.1.p1 GENE.GILJ01002795.1~~GILJ01002795.1.p1  ORF type:complete len:499 (-),score=90.26 GILJ01002795.1:174-1670(-)
MARVAALALLVLCIVLVVPYVDAKQKMCEQYPCACTGDRGYCKRGTLNIDPWLLQAVNFQYKLAYEQPLNQVSWLSTHNSGIAKAEGYGEFQAHGGFSEETLNTITHFFFKKSGVKISNQVFSFTDQLRMGIRFLEVDTHWSRKALRICHAGGVEIPKLDKLLKWVGTVLHKKIEWDTATLGCFSAKDELFTEAMEEIRTFLDAPENKNEVVFLYLDDQQDLADWDKTTMLVDQLRAAFGEWTLTPAQKDSLFGAGVWPSAKQMIDNGKRVIIGSRVNYGGSTHDYMFAREQFWVNEFGLRDLTPYPECGNFGGKNEGKMPRIVDDSLLYGPFEDPDWNDRHNDTNIQRSVDCNIWALSLDDATPDLVKKFIWTWQEGQPKALSDSASCAAMDVATGRWEVLPCDNQLYFACQSDADTAAWTLSSATVAGAANGIQSAGCPAGYHAAYPTKSNLNRALKDVIQAAAATNQFTKVWINYPMSTSQSTSTSSTEPTVVAF